MVRENHEQNAIRRFLLEQLSDSELQNFELRLLTEEPLSEEVEIVEDELIDDYLADELSSADRSRFEEVFLSTPERERKLDAGRAIRRHFKNNSPPPAPPKPDRFRFLKKWFGSLSIPIVVPVGVAAMIVIGVVVWRGAYYQSDLDKGLVALNEGYRLQRPVQGRISGLDYAPFIVTRSNEAVPVNELERNRADRFLSDALKEDGSAGSYHAMGKLYLLRRDFPAAINYLEQASKSDPNDPQIYADLGAAYLEKGKLELEAGRSEKSQEAGKGSEDLGRSLEYLKQALERNPNLLEALFNRALVHEYQQLYGQAEADWRSYLEKDPNSRWADDARQQLKRLEEKKLKSQKTDDSPATLVSAFAAGDENGAWEIFRRNHGSSTNKIIQGLIDSFLSDDARSAQSLAALNYLGQLQMRKTRDAFTADLAAVYTSATPHTRAMLIEARRQMADGSKLIRQSRFGEALALFDGARSNFEKAGDLPESLSIGAAIVQAAALQPDLPKGQEVLAQIIPPIEARNYKWLLAQCITRQAHIESNLNNYSKGISDANRALQLFRQSEDLSGVLGSFQQLAWFYLFLNDNQTSFSYLERALTLNEQQPAALTDIWPIHITTSLNLSARKLDRAALDYQKEALQLGLESKSPLLISRSYQYIGLTYGSLQQFDLALQNARLAYDQGISLANERNGQSIMANASLKLGDLYRARGDPVSALAAYDESLRLYEALEFAHHYSYSSHKGKFLAYLALNNDALASQELQTALGLFDEYREKILWERQKAFFFDREQDTYDLAIDFTYFRLGDKWRAFDHSEISRARNLRELMHQGAEVTQSYAGLDLKSAKAKTPQSAEPLNAQSIKQQLPEQVQLVQYAVLEKKLVIWLISRSALVTESVDVESAQLNELIAVTLKQIMGRDDAGATASLKNLYRLIIEPIKDKLEAGKVLCFIPDKVLHYVPFTALMSPDSGHYLLEDFAVMVSPSARFLIESTKQAASIPPVKEEHLLAVGNPSFDRRANPNAANLPDAEREVEQIKSNYPLHQVLVGPKAIRSTVMKEITRADVAHFAAHFEIDSRSSLSSILLLGPELGDRAHAQPSGLSAADIYQIKLPRTRLAVLSGCQTGIEQQFAGEGPIGFARAFLVAGVPVVVASLWRVDSDATSDLMIAFHRFRKIEKFPSAESLRLAQLQVMADGNYRSPYYWAGFTVIGGYATF